MIHRRTTPFTQMGRVVRFDFFTSFYVYLPLAKAHSPCPLVMAGVEPVGKVIFRKFAINKIKYLLVEK